MQNVVVMSNDGRVAKEKNLKLNVINNKIINDRFLEIFLEYNGLLAIN